METPADTSNTPSMSEISSFLSTARKQFEGSAAEDSSMIENEENDMAETVTDVQSIIEIQEKFKSRIVIPGDMINEVPPENDDESSEKINGGVVLGPGLSREGAFVYSTKCGILKHKKPLEHDIFWVDTHSKRYVPTKGEYVLGIVSAKAGDTFRVDIGTAEPASLSYLAFEGATKKNRPSVNLGDVIYARLLVASRDMEAELVCVDSYGKRAGMGVIGSIDPINTNVMASNSLLFTVPLNLVRKLLSKSCVLLTTLGKHIPYEIAVGMNGRIWIRGKKVRDTICLANAISVAEHMTNDEIIRMSNKLVDVLSGF